MFQLWILYLRQVLCQICRQEGAVKKNQFDEMVEFGETASLPLDQFSAIVNHVSTTVSNNKIDFSFGLCPSSFENWDYIQYSSKRSWSNSQKKVALHTRTVEKTNAQTTLN